jgi:MFS family permease
VAYLIGGFGLGYSAEVTLLVPLRAHQLGASFGNIGFITGIGALGPGLLAVTLGTIIDGIGPKTSFVLGTFASAGVSLLFVLVTNYWWFVLVLPIALTLQTFGWVASQSYITGLGDVADRPRLTGRFSFFVNVGQMGGPVLAGGCAELVGLRWAFVVPAGYSLYFAVLGLLLIDVRSTKPRQTDSKQRFGIVAATQL